MESQSDASLTDILPTPALRTELALLLLLCTDAMRRDLTAAFDLTPKLTATSTSTSNHVDDLLSLDDDENGCVPNPEEIRERRLRREQELGSSQLQGLRRAALMYFDAWRGKVLQRVCEVLGVRAEAVRQARKARKNELTAAEDQRRSQDLLNWAYGGEGRERSEASQSKQRYPAFPTKLSQLDKEKRVLLMNCTLLLLLGLETYPAHSRILLLHVTSSLHLDTSILWQHESQVAQSLLQAASQMSAQESRRKTGDSAHKWKVGLATVAGAGLLAVTGGLAAPLLAAGVGTVLGGIGLAGTAVSGLLGTLAGSSVLIGGLFGAYGGKMTGQMMDRYAKEVVDFKFLPVRKGKGTGEQQHKLRVTIGISGWVTTESDIDKPWVIFNSDTCESFALRWELDALLRLGVSLNCVIKTYVWQYASFELARLTLLGALAAGLWPLGLLKMAKVIDNPFSVGKTRADMAGKVLADALIARVQGERPVTLVGYSLGARVIYFAMLELAAQNVFGLVENVVLIGTPSPSDAETWTKIRSVVCGRVVNVYSTKDYILGLIYRASSIRIDVAGLQPIEDVNGIESFDASHLVESHDQYRYVLGQILKSVGFEDVDDIEVQAERDTLEALKAQDKVEMETRKDAETEAAEVEAVVEERTGTKITMIDMDEQEEQRKQELVRVAEKSELDSKSRKVETGGTLAYRTRSLDISEPEPYTKHPDPVCQSNSRRGAAEAEETDGVPNAEGKDNDPEEEETNEPQAEMTFLQPEPEPDSEPET